MTKCSHETFFVTAETKETLRKIWSELKNYGWDSPGADPLSFKMHVRETYDPVVVFDFARKFAATL